jgi:hypothetical protein
VFGECWFFLHQTKPIAIWFGLNLKKTSIGFWCCLDFKIIKPFAWVKKSYSLVFG